MEDNKLFLQTGLAIKESFALITIIYQSVFPGTHMFYLIEIFYETVI